MIILNELKVNQWSQIWTELVKKNGDVIDTFWWYFVLDNIQGRRINKKVINYLLQSTSIGCQPLVQGDCVTLLIFPVGNARRNLPVLKVRRVPGARVDPGVSSCWPWIWAETSGLSEPRPSGSPFAWHQSCTLHPVATGCTFNKMLKQDCESSVLIIKHTNKLHLQWLKLHFDCCMHTNNMCPIYILVLVN